jgi:hypothetical protein
MGKRGHKGGVKSLLEAALTPLPAPQAPTVASPAPDTPEMSDEEANELIEVYFELEGPAERDALFDTLAAVRLPVVDEFFTAMMDEDEDPYVRAAAAAELAHRGSADAIRALEQDLAEPEDAYFFTNAAQALAELRGPPFYDTLRFIWQDGERDPTTRREAMLGMETIDVTRALGDFVTFVDAQTEVATLPEDQIEVAMLAFVRHAHGPGEQALRRLQERIKNAALDADEQQELVAFVQEGLDLLAES